MAKSESLQASSLKVWWSRTPNPGNFGDILTPFIFDHYGINYEYQTLKAAEAICVGSVIRFARPDMMVLGSGVISRQDKIEPKARFLFVRGPITAQMIREQGGECPDIYGDPALLLPRIFHRNIKPIHDVGLFTHYVDLPNYPDAISPLGHPLNVLRKIWHCKRIISSSLHGIIAAHAYGIPAAWVKLGGVLTGDDVKFHDYAQSVGMDEMPLSTLDKPVFTLPNYDDSKIHEIMKSL